MKHTIMMLSVLSMTLGLSATALGACWDKLDELQASLERSDLSQDEQAAVQHDLQEAEATRATNDTARCEELVTDAQERLGMKAGQSEHSLPDSGGTDPDDRTSGTGSPHAAGNAEVPARYQTGATDIVHMSSDELLGREVRGASDEQIGEIEAVVRDSDTPPRGYAVVSVQDGNGVGPKHVLVGLDLIRVEPSGAVRTSAQTQAELAEYPEYIRDTYEIYEGSLAEVGQTEQ
jgi:hypothetical protein